MQKRPEQVNGYNNDKSETQIYSQKISLTPNGLSNGFDKDQKHQNTAYYDENPESVLQFKSPVNKMASLETQSLVNGDSGQAVTTSSPRTKDFDGNELGIVNDLIKLGLPRGHVSKKVDWNSNSDNPQSSRMELQTDLPESANTAMEDSLVTKKHSYASDFAGASLSRFGNRLIPNGDIEEVSENSGSYKDSEVKREKASKSSKSKKIKQKSETSIDSREQNSEDGRFLISPLPSGDKGQLITKKAKPRVRNESHPGSPKYVTQTSKPSVLSDDEYTINASSAHRYGRRSAPIFTKRFSASEFWNSGQTLIERAHRQDIANSRNLERQKSKSPTSNTIIKFPSKTSGFSSRLLRPNSVGPSSHVYSNQGFVNNGAGLLGLNEQVNSKGVVSYGSVDDTTKVVDHRGYHSELETGGWRHQDSSLLPGDQRYRERHLRKDSLGLNLDSIYLHDGTKLESVVQDSSGAPRGHSMKGIFRTSQVISPRDLSVKVVRAKDAMKMDKRSYEYIPESEDVVQKSSSSDESSEGSSSEDEGEGSTPTKKSIDIYEDKIEGKPEVRTELYYRRWYLLALFSLTAMLWNAIWSTWGPIAQSAKDVYGWSDGDIAMFTYLGNIPFLITMFPCAYLMDVTGMRMAMIFCCSFMFVGAGFRCIPGDIYTSTWLIRVGQFLNGVAGTIPMSGPALLSGLWFPPNQRATATAISTVAGYLGASISFVIGPLLVPEPDDTSPINGTFNLFSDVFDSNSSGVNITDHSDQERGIKTILYGECALAGLVFLLVLIYFPSKPPLPPSVSASIPREKYLNGLKMLARNKQFWICAIAFSVPLGVYESWQVILDINLDSKGISQRTAGWLDFYATVGGCVSGLLVSRFADLFTRQMKLFLLVFYSLATVAILWLTLVVLDIIPFDEVSIYAAVILAGVFLDGGSPLFFELTIEVSYPVGEGVTSGFSHMMCATAGTIFLIIVQIENIGTQWMNWCFLGTVGSTIPLLLLINTSYSRADVDDMEIDISDDEEAVTGIGAADTNEKTSLLKNSTV
ncbi:hypothetical protein BsWGS_09568 [Bradybaena similaris]